MLQIIESEKLAKESGKDDSVDEYLSTLAVKLQLLCQVNCWILENAWLEDISYNFGRCRHTRAQAAHKGIDEGASRLLEELPHAVTGVRNKDT